MVGPRAELPVFEVPRSLYIHVPVCRSKCAYCDFFSVPRTSLGGEALSPLIGATLARVAELASRFGAGVFDTVYVGGGTPSVLPRELLAALLEGLAPFAPSPREWTVEANPESLDAEFLALALGAGVTRLSLGVQSLDPALLRLLGRPAGAETALEALELAAGSGLDVSADLIAGLPRRGGLSSEVAALLGFGLGHLSVYDLILEEGTPLEALARQGGLALLSEDEGADEREEAETLLASRGFGRYEVSNYALPGKESLHNLAYWRMDSYLGAGPGAVSTLAAERGGSSLRIEELASIEGYTAGSGPRATETFLAPRDSAIEVLMMGVRTREGLDLGRFEARFGFPLPELLPATLAKWKRRLVPALGRLALDSRGLDLSNGFLAEALLELERTLPAIGA